MPDPVVTPVITGTGPPTVVTTPAPAAVIPVAGPPPVAAPPVIPAAAPPAASTGITLSPEQWAAYTASQTRLTELESAERQRAAESADAQVKALQAKGEIEKAFALQRQHAETQIEAERKKYADTEARAKRYALDGELGRALSAHQLTVGAAAHLTKLLRDEFTVEAQGDSFAVRSKDFRSVSDFIAATLATPEYSSFVRAQNPGGGTAGSTGTQSLPTPTGTAPAAPKTLMEGLILDHQERAAAAKSQLPAVAGTASSFGLRAARQA